MISDFTSRALTYYKRHGLRATLQHTVIAARRLMSGRMVLFYYDLKSEGSSGSRLSIPFHLMIERKDSKAEVREVDWQQITRFWNPDLAEPEFAERFQRRATLWLIRSDGQLAGYGWTLVGGTIQPHYYPLGSDDVHLFDFLVFPEYRGRGVNPALVTHILRELRAENRIRAYIEAAEWNAPQLHSLDKTGFRLVGFARKASFFGRTFVQWTGEPGMPRTAASRVTPLDSSTTSSFLYNQRHTR